MSAGSRRDGFALIATLAAVAILAAASLAALRYSAAQQQREKESWLLFVGSEYRAALERYARAGVGVPGQGPRELDDLLVDRRGRQPLHHLRRLYPDPMTGRADWTLLRDSGGYITGLHSSSTRVPFKRSGFGKNEQGFAQASSYREWVFRPAADSGAPIGQNDPDDSPDARPDPQRPLKDPP